MQALTKTAEALGTKGALKRSHALRGNVFYDLSIEIKRINPHKLDLLFYKLQDTQWSLYWKAHLLSGIEPW